MPRHAPERVLIQAMCGHGHARPILFYNIVLKMIVLQFRGMVVPDQAFPFPQVLTEEQAENLGMLVEPTEKFMTEVNDSAWNDTNEKVHPETVQVSF